MCLQNFLYRLRGEVVTPCGAIRETASSFADRDVATSVGGRAGEGGVAERLLLRIHGLCLPRADGRLLPNRSRRRARLLRPGRRARFTGGPCEQGHAVEARLLLGAHGLRRAGPDGRLLPDRRRHSAGLLQPGPGPQLIAAAAAVAVAAAASASQTATVAAVAAVASRSAGRTALRRRAARLLQAPLPRRAAAPAAAEQDLG